MSLCQAKKVNAVSIISCGNTYSKSIKKLLEYKDDVSLGLHATWVGEKPILAPQEISSIIAKNKYFVHDFKTFYLKWLLGTIKIEDIKLELEEQILKLLGVLGKIDHIDSHQHIHMIPQIFKVCIELAKKYKIPRIRTVNEDLSRKLPNTLNPTKFIGERLLNKWVKKNKTLAKDSLIETTESFFGLRYSGKYFLIKDYIYKLLKENRADDIEINFHPAFKTDSLITNYPWYENGDVDYNLLLSS